MGWIFQAHMVEINREPISIGYCADADMWIKQPGNSFVLPNLLSPVVPILQEMVDFEVNWNMCLLIDMTNMPSKTVQRKRGSL